MLNKSPLQHIRAKCLDCAGTYQEVKDCAFADCPLHPLRNGKHLPKGISRLKSIRSYCVTWCMNDQQQEVRLCPVADCGLYPFRFGKNQYRKRINRATILTEHALECKKVASDAGFLQQKDAG